MRKIAVALSLLSIATVASAERISVPSDSKATYDSVLIKPINGNLLVITKRTGPSGVSFASREIDCKSSTFRYTGTGDTFNEMIANAPYHDTERMGPLTDQSISTYVALYACSKS